MRKNLLVVLFLLTILPSAKVFSQYVISESFEGETFPPAGWLAANLAVVPANPDGTSEWTGTFNDSYYGFGSAFIDYEENGGRDMLKTPHILNVQASYSVSFWIKRQTFDVPYTPDVVDVRVSTTGITTPNFSAIIGSVNVANLPDDQWVKYTFSLATYAGQSIYIAFDHKDTNGNGCFIDDVNIGAQPAADAALTPVVTASPAAPVVVTGTSITLTDTIKNYGTVALPIGTPIKFNVNDGAVVATVNTTSAIAPGGTQVVTFSGANAFTPLTPGSYFIKIYADLPADANHSNDTSFYSVRVQTPIASFPYFQDFNNPAGWAWSTLWSQIDSSFYDDGVTVPIPSIISPNGKPSDTAMVARFYDAPAGFEGILRAPLFNFTGVLKPVMNFYVSYSSYTDENNPIPPIDSLEVLVSTDGGLTFNPAPYAKSFTTNPSLATTALPAPGSFFLPTDATMWRHEVVDLSQFANNPSVMIVFNGVSAFGNYCLVDNVSIVNQNPLYFYKAPVAAPGIIGPINNKVTFLTTGNAAGGDIVFEGNVGNYPPNNTFAANTTATAPDGSIFTPDIAYPLWTTVTYSGNDSDRAVYNIAIDITGLPILNPDKMYFMKRSDQSGEWVCLPTLRTGSVLSTSGLSNFSDFGLGSLVSINPVPIRLLTFEGKLVRDQVNLKWETANELNNNGFDIERKTKTSWEKVGYVQSLGNSTNKANYAFLDRSPVIGSNYYRLKQIDLDGKATYSNVVKIDLRPSKNVHVFQNTPNPFSASTSIRYTVAEKTDVKIAVYSPDGKRLATLVDETKSAGVYEATWNAAGLAAGTYYYKVITGDNVSTLKMLKIK